MKVKNSNSFFIIPSINLDEISLKWFVLKALFDYLYLFALSFIFLNSPLYGRFTFLPFNSPFLRVIQPKFLIYKNHPFSKIKIKIKKGDSLLKSVTLGWIGCISLLRVIEVRRSLILAQSAQSAQSTQSTEFYFW